MRRLLIGILLLGNISTFAGEITTNKNGDRIYAKCMNQNEESHKCTSWLIGGYWQGKSMRHEALGRVDIDQINDRKLDLRVKERTVARLWYFPATQATWGCLVSDKYNDIAHCNEGNYAWMFEPIAATVVFGAIPSLYDVASLPIRVLTRKIRQKRADSLEKKMVNEVLPQLIDDDAGDLKISHKKFGRYFVALMGLPLKLELFEKASAGKLVGCHIEPVIDKYDKTVDYKFYIGNKFVANFYHFEIDEMEITLKNLIDKGTCGLSD